GAPIADTVTGLRPAFHGNSVRNLRLARELIRLTAALNRANIETLALKGPALAVAAYGDIAMRQFSELDLLFHGGDVERGAEILVSEGYVPVAGYGVCDLGRLGAYEIAMKGEFAEIDLHWRLTPSYFPIALDGDDLWRRAKSVEIEGVSIGTLSDSDHYLYL